MSETALAAALKRAGFDKSSAVYEFVSKLLKGGMSREKACEALWQRMHSSTEIRTEALRLFVDATAVAAKELPGEGRGAFVDSDQRSRADTRQTERDGKVNGAMPQGHHDVAEPSLPIADGDGLGSRATTAAPVLPTVREPIVTLSDAGRILQREQQAKAKPPGAGALQPRAYETRRAVRGESWLLSYAIPNGPKVLELTWHDAEQMQRRMFREGGERVVASLIIGEMLAERDKMGRVAGHQIIGDTLPPTVIDRIAQKYSPEKAAAKARALLQEHQRQEIEHVA